MTCVRPHLKGAIGTLVIGGGGLRLFLSEEVSGTCMSIECPGQSKAKATSNCSAIPVDGRHLKRVPKALVISNAHTHIHSHSGSIR